MLLEAFIQINVQWIQVHVFKEQVGLWVVLLLSVWDQTQASRYPYYEGLAHPTSLFPRVNPSQYLVF